MRGHFARAVLLKQRGGGRLDDGLRFVVRVVPDTRARGRFVLCAHGRRGGDPFVRILTNGCVLFQRRDLLRLRSRRENRLNAHRQLDPRRCET